MDLLWFGGIGTYVKATAETHAEVNDRANDALRVDAATLRARIVGEGANLAMTQRARIEYALAGGRLNTDAIDNSAGVDTSDHEVNIKIATTDLLEAGVVAPADRPAYLAAMTEEVAALVLRHNYLQTQALSVAQAQPLLPAQTRLIHALERDGQLNRAVEFLPTDAALAARATAGQGLTRPESAVLLAYAKMTLYDDLLASDLPDDAALEPILVGYFPAPIRRTPDILARHRLRREIIASTVANDLVNRMGATFTQGVQARTGHPPAAIARAYLVTGAAFELDPLWRGIEALDNQVSATVQTALLVAVQTAAAQALEWFLGAGARDIEATAARFAPGLRSLADTLPAWLPDTELARLDANRATYAPAPAALIDRVLALTTLSTAMDVVAGRRDHPRARSPNSPACISAPAPPWACCCSAARPAPCRPRPNGNAWSRTR